MPADRVLATMLGLGLVFDQSRMDYRSMFDEQNFEKKVNKQQLQFCFLSKFLTRVYIYTYRGVSQRYVTVMLIQKFGNELAKG